MKQWRISKWDCGCEADITEETAMVVVRRGRMRIPKRAKVVLHYRKRDEAHFWHWSDQRVIKI